MRASSTAGYCPKRARRLAAMGVAGLRRLEPGVYGFTTETHVGGYVAPIVGAAVVGVGALVMGLPTAFIGAGAIAGAFIGTWVGNNATKTQET